MTRMKKYSELNATLIRNLKRKIEELRESETRFKLLFEMARDGILATDAKTRKFVFANPAICEMTGYGEKELLSMGINNIHPKKDLPYVMNQFTMQLQGKITVVKDMPVLRKDKTVFYCDINSYPLTLGGRELLIGLFRDVTERRQAEEALRQSESKYRTLLENLPQKIFFKDRNSVYISCNNNYVRDLKIKANEIAGRTDYEFYPRKLAEKYRADDRRVMRAGKTKDIDEEYIKDGKKMFVHTVKTPVKDEKGRIIGILGIFWDITARKKTGES